MIESFADDQMREHLDKFYRLVRAYLQTLGKRMHVLANQSLEDSTEALNLGFELIISAAFEGALTEERVRQFWINDLARLSDGKKRSDSEAANVAIDAFTF